MPLIQKLTELASKLPPAAIELLFAIGEAILKSDDPMREIERRIEAEAAHAAARLAVEKALAEQKG